MQTIRSLFSAFWHDETGATAIEYGLLVGLIAAVIVVVVSTLGTTIQCKFWQVLNKLGGTATQPAGCTALT